MEQRSAVLGNILTASTDGDRRPENWSACSVDHFRGLLAACPGLFRGSPISSFGATAITMITSNSWTITGRYDPLGQTKLPQGDAPELCGGSVRGPQSPSGCHEKCGDTRPYADVLGIASAKAFCAGCGKSAREATRNASIGRAGQESDGYYSARSACCSPGQRRAFFRKAGAHDHPFPT